MSSVNSAWTGVGVQSISAAMFVSPNVSADSRIAIKMNTTIPAEYGVDMEGQVVYNYISFQEYDTDDDPLQAVCTTTVGNEWDHEVKQYLPDIDLAAE